MTAQAQAGLSPGTAGLPSLPLDQQQLGDLELLLSGAFAPLTGFLTTADLAAVSADGRLAGGTPWPVPVTLEVPASSVPDQARQVGLADPEGTPLAVLTITERTGLPAAPGRGGAAGAGPLVRLAGPVASQRELEHGAFRRLMLTPAQVRGQLAEAGDGPVLALATRGPLHRRQLGQLRHVAGQLKARLLLLPLVAGPAEVVTRPEALIRTVLAAAASLPPGTLVVPVPMAARSLPGPDAPARELAVRALVAAAYGATHLLADPADPAVGAAVPGAAASPAPPGGAIVTASTGAAGPSADGLAAALRPVIPVLSVGTWAYDPRAEVWRPLTLIEPGTERDELSPGELGDLLDAGAQVPDWFTPEPVARELRRARPPRAQRGFVLFLTGLSGSGKSTIARDLRDALAERGEREVSLLDGDLVRQLLSAGLTFSRADRDLNVTRIGFVAAEIARHGGIAICAPIAPYAAARARVRQLVSEVGDFLLIHVATPVQVCEARDRKGLYAKARAGLIGQFTGVSDPYEEPADAELTIDTSVLSRAEATGLVLGMLTSGGWLPAPPQNGARTAAS
ncbi:MAG TPA: adenylyl-sulfate kinase [Streptosporangiaceae bacterium]